LKAAHNKQPRHEKNVSGNRATPIAPREITGEVSKKVELHISGISGMQTSSPLKAAHNKEPRHEKNVSGNRATPIAPREITGEVSKKVELHNGKSHSFDISVTELSLKKPEADGADGCKGCNQCNQSCSVSCRSCSCNAGPELSKEAQPGDSDFKRFSWNEIDNA